MAILTTSDFTKYSEVMHKVTTTPAFIADDLVSVYWHDLADTLNIPVANLPTSPEKKVKEFLILKVCVDVAFSSIGSDLSQIAENIAVDQWELRYNTWSTACAKAEADIKADEVYDPDNPPDDDTVYSTPSIVETNRG
jgi:hypothetical protein